MATQVWRLQMQAPLHIGTGHGITEEARPYVPSDTLFSALVITWLETSKHRAIAGTLRADFADAPALLLTSAFPYAGPVYLLPRPRLPLRPQMLEGESPKKMKRIAWVSSTVFSALIAGIDQDELNELWRTAVLLQHGSIWVTAQEAAELAEILKVNEEGELSVWSNMTVPHVAVNRQDNASNLFFMQRVHFSPGCGLWAAARSNDPAWLARVNDGLALLGDGGIGGQRSRGHGQFRLDREPPPLALPIEDANQMDAEGYCVLLSRLAPSAQEMALLKADYANYELTTVGGHNGTPWDRPLIRNSLRLLSEGSIIGAASRWPGQLVNLNPHWDDEAQQVSLSVSQSHANPRVIEHAIYRYGFGFTLPVILGSGIDKNRLPD